MAEMPQYEKQGECLLVRAPAKLNLTLLVAGKRTDGFHEIETLMTKIDRYDEVTLHRGTAEGIELSCTGPHWAPPGQDNLVYRAAQLLLDAVGMRPNVRIGLKKNIPAGSGLGSASSDAAATLMGLNRYYELGLDRKKLVDLGAQLGSDVPFFLYGPLCMCKGRGERVEELDTVFEFTAALFIPHISVSTAMVYRNYRHDAERFQRLQAKINGHIRKNRIDFAAKMCTNMLTESCFDLERGLGELRRKIKSAGLGPVCLSGSGCSLYCLFDSSDVQQLREWSNILAQRIGCSCEIVQNIRW